jgi:hypothetical protein
MALKVIYVVCACGQPVDMIEYDDAATSRAVSDVMAALAMDEAEARELVGQSNPGAELTGEEQARKLADLIIRREVPDRDEATYVCAAGHTDYDLSVTDVRPAPVAPSIVRIPADVADRLAALEEQARQNRASGE